MNEDLQWADRKDCIAIVTLLLGAGAAVNLQDQVRFISTLCAPLGYDGDLSMIFSLGWQHGYSLGREKPPREHSRAAAGSQSGHPSEEQG
jgi:hypothetical protein